MKILLIGEIYSPNLGDGVIYEVVKKNIQKIYPNSTIISLDISGKTKYKKNNQPSKYNNLIPSIIKYPLNKIKRYLLLNNLLNKIDFSNINKAIFVGGQLFQDYFLNQIHLITKKLSKYQIPTIFNAIGLGPLKNKNILIKSLNYPNIKSISLRDSYQEFKKFYNKQIPIFETLDPVLELSNLLDIKKNKSNIIGIGFISLNYLNKKISLKEYYNLNKYIIDYLDKKNIKWQLFCNGDPKDYNIILNFTKYYNIPSTKISPYPQTPKELINIISNYNRIISFRLHSHIIASSLNIPTLSFNWDNKVLKYFQKLNKKEYCILLDNNIYNNLHKILPVFLSIDKDNFYTQKFLKHNKNTYYLKITKNI